MSSDFPAPPRALTAEGKKRRVGVEIEYSDLGVPESAALVRRLFGGEVIEKDLHLMEVKDTRHGDFLVELDLRLLHRNKAKGVEQAEGDDELARFLDTDFRDIDPERAAAAFCQLPHGPAISACDVENAITRSDACAVQQVSCHRRGGVTAVATA